MVCEKGMAATTIAAQLFPRKNRLEQSAAIMKVKRLLAFAVQNKILALHVPDFEDGDVWASLPMVLRPLPTTETDRVSTPTPSNGVQRNGNSPYSPPNGSS